MMQYGVLKKLEDMHALFCNKAIQTNASGAINQDGEKGNEKNSGQFTRPKIMTAVRIHQGSGKVDN